MLAAARRGRDRRPGPRLPATSTTAARCSSNDAAAARTGRTPARRAEALGLEAARARCRRWRWRSARRPRRAADDLPRRAGPGRSVGPASIELGNAQVSAPLDAGAVPHRRRSSTGAARTARGAPGRGTSRSRSGGLELGSEAFTVAVGERHEARPRRPARDDAAGGAAAAAGRVGDADRRGLPGRGGLPHADRDRVAGAAGALAGDARRGRAVGRRGADASTPSAPAPTGASPDWTGPPFTIGDPHPGTWRETHTAAAGRAARGPRRVARRSRTASASAFMVMERNDLPSSRARLRRPRRQRCASTSPATSSASARSRSRPTSRTRADGPGRVRVRAARASRSRCPRSSPASADGDGDEPWQFHRYLVGAPHRCRTQHAVTFNSNGIDANRISTGAKDDMDYATVQEVAPLARRLGVDTFILDDGWQARSGDWQPDSPAVPRAALGRQSGLEVPAALPRRGRSPPCATRSRR